jgi:hypothetical protein
MTWQAIFNLVAVVAFIGALAANARLDALENASEARADVRVKPSKLYGESE